MWQQCVEQLSAALAALKETPPSDGATQRHLSAMEAAIATLEDAGPPPSDLEHGAFEPAMKYLKGHRHFPLLFVLGEVLVRNDLPGAYVRHHFAQAAIELGDHALAQSVLYELAEDPDVDAATQSDARSMLGRVYKQHYVDGMRMVARGESRRDYRGYLRRAIVQYGQEYDPDDPPAKSNYPGVNLIALVHRAERDGVDVGRALAKAKTEQRTAAGIAEELLESLAPYANIQRTAAESGGAACEDPWAIASTGEAILALAGTEEPHKWGRADEWFGAYAFHAADPFQLYGTIRQLEEVWQIDPNDVGGGMSLSILRVRALQLGGGVNVSSTDLQRYETWGGDADEPGGDESFEKRIGGLSPESVQRYNRIMFLAGTVGRVNKRPTNRTIGTGFLFDGGALAEELAGTLLFMTNAHVVSEHDSLGLRPGEVEVEFGRILQSGEDAFYPNRRFRIAEILWESGRHELDATIARLDGEGLDQLHAAPLMPFDLYGTADCSVCDAFVLGYPEGGDLSTSEKENQVRFDPAIGGLAYGWRFERHRDWKFVHYKAPTLGGNSGSPVFDNDLGGVYALHHRGAKHDHWGSNLDLSSGGQRIHKLNGVSDSLGRPVSWVANEGVLISSILEQARADRAPAGGAEDDPGGGGGGPSGDGGGPSGGGHESDGRRPWWRRITG